MKSTQPTGRKEGYFMRIKYYGQMKGIEYNTRSAVIYWDDRNKKDGRIADRIIDLAIKVSPWKKIDGYHDCYCIQVDSREEYEEFKTWYKEVKRMFIQCERHGF